MSELWCVFKIVWGSLQVRNIQWSELRGPTFQSAHEKWVFTMWLWNSNIGSLWRTFIAYMCLCSWPWLDNCVFVGRNTHHVSLIHWFNLVQYSASWPDTHRVHCKVNCLCRDCRLTGLLKVTYTDFSSEDSRFKVIFHYTTQGCMIK